MSENLEPISLSEAARILSESRWSGEASEQAPVSGTEPKGYGIDAIERGQGYEPMRPAHPIAPPDVDPIDGSVASEALRQDAPHEAPAPIPVTYLEQAGERAGQKMPENQTVSLRQASADVARFRETVGEQIKSAEDQELARVIDELRAGDPQPAADMPQEQQAQPDAPVALDKQFQPEQAPAAEDPVAKALQDPAVLNAVQQEVGRYAAQAEQMAQSYAAITATNAQSAYANLLASFPEVQNVRHDQLQTALQVLAQSSPEKAQAITRHIETVNRLTHEAQLAQAANQQAQQTRARQEFARAAQSADADLESHVKAQGISDEQFGELQKEARAMLHEFGVTDQEMAWRWNNDPAFRSLPAQMMMMDAARWRMAQRGIKEKVTRPVPTVQRPGAGSIERGSEADYRFKSMNAKIDSTQGRDQIRAAAEYVAARRRGR
jgi:hypothetical protein